MESYFIQLAGEGLMTTLLLAAPVLAVGLAAGIVMGLIQTLLQIHDPLLSFVPKAIAVAVTLGLVLPWMTQMWLEYSRELFSRVPFFPLPG